MLSSRFIFSVVLIDKSWDHKQIFLAQNNIFDHSTFEGRSGIEGWESLWTDGQVNQKILRKRNTMTFSLLKNVSSDIPQKQWRVHNKARDAKHNQQAHSQAGASFKLTK